MVDSHWEQLVLGLGYQFWSFQLPKGTKKNEFLDPKIVAVGNRNALKALYQAV